MAKKKIFTWPVIILLIVAPFVLRPVISSFFSHNTDDVREKMEEHLYERYGEEFVVDMIGTRSSRGEEFYQARIYPKSIVGTNKEGDDYYYASASVDKESFGRLGGVGDSYGLTKINFGAEEYLLPKTKEIFGERVKIKPEVKYKIENSTGFYEWNKEPNFEKALNNLHENPNKIRIELDLDIYVFDRIENEEEKEERREDIFEYIQYLKDEGLFEYLEMRVVFVDERVLAPSYNKFEREINSTPKVTKKVEGQESRTVDLPPRELRELMSAELQREINKMDEEELLKRINNLRMDELTYKEIRENNTQYRGLIYSKGMMKERYTSSYKDGSDNVKGYNNVDDIILDRSLVYVFIR